MNPAEVSSGAPPAELSSVLRAFVQAWIVYIVAAFVTSPATLIDPLAGVLPGLVGISTFAVLGRKRLRRHEAPAPIASDFAAMAVPLAAAIVGVSPAVLFLPVLEGYAYLPFPQLLASTALGAVPFALLMSSRLADAQERERRRWWLASLAVFTCHAAWISTAGLQVLFLVHYPSFERARVASMGSGEWEPDVQFGVFAFDAVGEAKSFQTSDMYFAMEMCRPRYREQEMCFSGAGGMGFYFLPAGAQPPTLNQSVEGRLYGGWRWYLDD